MWAFFFCGKCHKMIYLFIDCIEKSGQGCGRVDNKAVFWYNNQYIIDICVHIFQRSKIMICKRCGKSIKSGSLNCESCGYKHKSRESSGLDFVQSQSGFATVKRTENLKVQDIAPVFPKKNIAIIAGIAAIATAAVAMMGIAFFKHIDKETPLPAIVEDLGDYKETSVRFSTLGEANMVVESKEEAFDVLDLVSGVYGYTDARAQLRFVDTVEGNGIAKYYVFEQVYGNKKVYGKNMIVAVSTETRNVICISGNYCDIKGQVEVGEIKAETAKRTAQKKSGGYMAEPERVILCMNKPIDAWHVRLEGEKHVFVDTVAGKVLLETERDIVTDADEALAEKVVAGLGKEQKNNIYTESHNMAIVNPMNADMPFNGIIVSEALYSICNSTGEDDTLKNKMPEIWNEASYLLPADADFTDCITAIDILADAGMAEPEERKRMLGIFSEYQKEPESRIEVAGPDSEIIVLDADGRPTVNYTYEIYRSDADLKTGKKAIAKGTGSDIRDKFSFDAGRIYCLIITEKNNPDEQKKEYIYCSSDTDADYKLYTQFNKTKTEVSL